MSTLNWIGKEAVVNHHHQVPFHLLKDVPDLACGEPGDGNLIVQGDNLVALKALLPYYAGQVKCIYIDPPYNTGQDERSDEGKRTGWIYSDNVNSPEIHDWLGKVVGEEAEDLSRHDKWLCMMYPRLALLQKFLRPVGMIFASIDEIEVPTLRLLFDEIFGATNRIGTLVWKNATDNNPTNIATEHEYVLCYARNKEKLPREWKSVNLAVKDKLLTDDESKIIELKVYVKDYRAKLASLFELDGRIGTYEIKNIFPDDKRPFDFPKPTELIEELLSFTTSDDDLILDSFAGSGTTGHAVLKLNHADRQDRRFILVEMKESIARKITAERVRRVAQGYKNAKDESVDGLGGSFRYCELGEPLFDEDGKIRETVSFAELARHVYFTETGEPLPRERVTKSPFLGECRGVGIYLLYNGILDDKSAGGGNVLTRAVLAKLPKFDGQKVIYCAGCLLGKDRLQAERILVRQTPYEIKVS